MRFLRGIRALMFMVCLRGVTRFAPKTMQLMFRYTEVLPK